MNWWLIVEIAYLIILVLVCLKVIYDTRSHVKTLAYLLLVIFVPVFGIIFYFSFGINYRKHKLYSKKLVDDVQLASKLEEDIFRKSKQTLETSGPAVQTNKELAVFLLSSGLSTLSSGNKVKLLINGEQKFAEVLEALRNAKHHIHLEYYIFEEGGIGREIEEILMEKAAQGVKVRFIYDDFGSRSIRRNIAKRLNNAGVEALPFYKIMFLVLANRLNYRNHRKIIIVDGAVAFVGGINVADRYLNNGKNKLFWRDTHLRIDGPGVHYLQYLFLCDWNFCTHDSVYPDRNLFPHTASITKPDNKVVQIAASGPDSDVPTILFSLIQAINLATKEILITTPYFMPGDTMMNALVIASMSGVKVKMLVPGISDSAFIDIASRSHFEDLLRAGVEIYFYRKGFVHAKTMVADRKLAIVGTANMDSRSFELNFEVNAIVYDEETAAQLADVFEADLRDSEMIDAVGWHDRPVYKVLVEKVARLVSPLL